MFAPVELLSFCSEVCSWKNQTTDPLNHSHLVKIDQQADRHVEQLHVTQELRLVDMQNLFCRLGLDPQASPQPARQNAAVLHGYTLCIRSSLTSDRRTPRRATQAP